MHLLAKHVPAWYAKHNPDSAAFGNIQEKAVKMRPKKSGTGQEGACAHDRDRVLSKKCYSVFDYGANRVFS